ncbi:hypothetical protein AT868_08635 [Campylobacter jejuni]|nr:hypothetical protein [Campylobacter jejuni]
MNIINEFFVSFILIKLYFKFKVCRKIKFPLLWKFYFSKWKFYFSADKYSSSSNEFLALEYNKIRSNLGELLRSIEELRVVEDREKLYLIIKNLQKGKEILKEIDTLTLSNVEHLISVRKITTAEGISILNDTTFAAKIAEELIGAVEVIFSKDISN